MEQPYQCTGAKTKFRPKLPPAQIAPAYPNNDYLKSVPKLYAV